MHNLLFCAHKPCINYVTKTLLVALFLADKRFVRGQGQKSEQKHTKKYFVGFNSNYFSVLFLCADYVKVQFISSATKIVV